MQQAKTDNMFVLIIAVTLAPRAMPDLDQKGWNRRLDRGEFTNKGFSFLTYDLTFCEQCLEPILISRMAL